MKNDNDLEDSFDELSDEDIDFEDSDEDGVDPDYVEESEDKEEDITIPDIQDEATDEVFVNITQEDLCNEISVKTDIPVETVKNIMETFTRHQLQSMGL